MIATLDLTGGIVLYTGVHLVSKVHIGGIPSALTTSNYLSLNLGQQFSCNKYPRYFDNMLFTFLFFYK